MRATSFCHIALLVAAASIAGSAHAEYRCNSEAILADKGACAAAEQGPEALRRYVERMRSLQSLQFFDYVNKDTLLAWDRKERRERAALESERAPNPELARSSTR